MIFGLLGGAVVGAILGLTGAGGGVLATPMLVLGIGLSASQAAPVALIAVAVAAAVGTAGALRSGLVRYRAASVMAMAGALFAPLGLHFARVLPPRVVVTAFCAVMLIVAARMLLQVFGSRTTAATSVRSCPCRIDSATGRFRWTGRCSASLAFTGAFAGLFTGMLGVGGGFVIVPALRQFSDADMQTAAATSLMVVALVSSATAAGTVATGVHLPAIGWPFIGATVAGLIAGRRLAGRIPVQWLQMAFAVLVVGVAMSWLAKTLL